MIARRIYSYCREERGASAVEFALVVPVICTLTIGAFQMCLLMFANNMLQFATDDAARCASVKTTICTGAGSTQSHAAATFGFAGMSPTFTASSAACGSKVIGSASYTMNAIVASVTVPLSASSCFPIQD